MANGKIRVATSHYHVGHAIAPMAALEKGFFKEEGLDRFELLLEGLIPGFVEKEALSVAMEEHPARFLADAGPTRDFLLPGGSRTAAQARQLRSR